MRSRIIAMSLLVSSGFFATPSYARPYRTDAAGTAAPGNIEIEAAADYWNDKASFGLNMKQGITSRMDLGFHINDAVIPDSTRAFSNATISAKFDLIPTFASVAFTGALGGSAYSLKGALTKAWGPIKASVDLGGEFTAGARDADLSWGANPTYAVGPATLGAELRGNQHEANWWQAGAQVKLTDWIAFDVGLGDDFHDGNDWHVATGVWIALPEVK